jgi:eukaryotic-like serine/threonine-protein kinase
VTLSPGSRLGPYEILAPIGAGGMGEVYRARDSRLGREVAIKVLPASFSADPDRLRRFEQEARAAGILNHPNITAVYDIGSDEAGEPYVVSELLEGETLRAALAGGRLPARRAVDYALQIAHGLAAAHEKGIVHRDLKPENLFVTRDGRVKILDFGLAKLTHQEEGSQVTNLPTATAGTEPGVVLGTLGYMSPEQVRGREADARSDIFSFGAILYEMLAGQRAFRGDSAADTMSAILKEDPPELSVTNQGVPPGLERVVRHCLEKSPERRFHSAHDLAFDLEALSDGSGLSATKPAARSRARGALPAAAGAIVLAALAALAGYAVAQRAGSRRTTVPTFHRVTFRRGFIHSARFAPDGQTIVYSGAWDGRNPELFTSRVGAVESRSMSLPSAGVLAISSTGEMAIDFLRPAGVPDVLARLSLAGGVPREVTENPLAADWSPDGKVLGLIRTSLQKPRSLEFPIGKVLYQSPTLNEMRVSPAGDTIAVANWGNADNSIGLVKLEGGYRRLVSGLDLAGPICWRPDGRELWFSTATPGATPNVYAVDMDGRTRLVLRSPAWMSVHDLAADGRALVAQHNWRGGIGWLVPGAEREEEASWLDWSVPSDLSSDGKTLLFSEEREGGGVGGSVYVRRGPTEPAVRLGEGRGLAISPDGKWALARSVETGGRAEHLLLLPTGIGEQKAIATGSLRSFFQGAWLPGGEGVIVRAVEAGKAPGLYVVDLASGRVRAISGEGATGPIAVSADGRFAAGRVVQTIQVFSLTGNAVRPLPGQAPGELPIAWTGDGKSVYVFRPGVPPVDVIRIDATTGAREMWKRLSPLDAAGVESLQRVFLASDANGYAYGYGRRTSDLYVVEGLR